ncbi:UL36 very large tegument protein [Streptomyces tritici]|uniref:UL36 very large tegument protein n=1 Tax=Streptomyces tritici TaxID=2054410 RepID=UPI003AF1AAE0
MTVHQQTAEIDAFVRFLRDVEARSTPGAGWYGVFAARDPEGLRACLDGTEVLPWDVVESLLRDLGEPPETTAHARRLHAAAAAAYDRRPGGAESLRDRRALMDRERRAAEDRARELAGRLRTAAPAEAAGLSAELSWAHDDRTRAAARVEELTARLAAVTEPAPVPAAEPAAGPHADPPRRHGAEPSPRRPAAESGGRRRPRGARYAWVGEEQDGAEAVAVPVLPGAGAAPPRGARFGGAAEAPDVAPAPAGPPPARVGAEAARAAGNAVYTLRRLRAQGRSGEAYALLCEALAGPPEWLPVLARELHRAGLAADWATLLWEAASLPPESYAAVVGALADAGRAEDREQVLRQGVARPVAELARVVHALEAGGRTDEVRALLAALVRTRSPEEAAELAAADPGRLVPLLLAALRAAAPALEPALLHALRAHGLPTG